MNKIIEHDTHGHLLATDGLPCMQRGFTGMGLSEPLKTAEILEGSFYHCFRSKEAFGVVILKRHYTAYHRRLATHFNTGTGSYRDRILAYYQGTLSQFSQHGVISGYLTVKLSAEMCDPSEDVRTTMDKGAWHIIVLSTQALGKGQTSHCLSFVGEPLQQAQVPYTPRLDTNLQAKISRSATPLENALVHVKNIITTPAV